MGKLYKISTLPSSQVPHPGSQKEGQETGPSPQADGDEERQDSLRQGPGLRVCHKRGELAKLE